MTKHCGWANETSPARIHPCAMVHVSIGLFSTTAVPPRTRKAIGCPGSLWIPPIHKILSSPRRSGPPIDVSCPFLSAYLPPTKIKNEKLNIIIDEMDDDNDDGRTDGRMDEGKIHGIVPCRIADRMISISQRRKKQFKCVWETFGKLPRYSTKRLIPRLHRTFAFQVLDELEKTVLRDKWMKLEEAGSHNTKKRREDLGMIDDVFWHFSWHDCNRATSYPFLHRNHGKIDRQGRYHRDVV
jgi:hypothetical protein